LRIWATSRGDESDYGEARRIWEEALEIAVETGQAKQEGTYRSGLAILALYRGELEDAAAYFSEGIRLHRSVGFQEGVAYTRLNYSELLLWLRQIDQALAEAEASLHIFATLGNSQGIALARIRVGVIHIEAGRLEEARRMLAEGLGLAREIGVRRCEMYATDGLARSAGAAGEFAAAQDLFRESIEIARQIGDKKHVGDVLAHFGAALCLQGKEEQAYLSLAAAGRVYDSLGITQKPADMGLLETVRAKLGPRAAQLEKLTGSTGSDLVPLDPLALEEQ